MTLNTFMRGEGAGGDADRDPFALKFGLLMAKLVLGVALFVALAVVVAAGLFMMLAV